MTELNIPHALWLLLIGTVMAGLSLYGLRAARRMAHSPRLFRQKLIEKQATHALAIIWSQSRSEESIRSWGVMLSRLAITYALISVITVLVVSALLIMHSAGMDSTVSPIVEALARVEADLAC